MGDFGNIFSNTWAFILVMLFFGGSIFVHELGHYLAARMRGLKVLRFSIGFGPRIFQWTGKDGCVYIISLLPFGGYVALPQLADMGALEGGNDEEHKKLRDLPKASCADKIIVSVAGAFFNVLFAIVLATIVWIVGIPKNSAYETNVVGFVPETISNIDGTKIACPAKQAGIKVGDKILSIDGHNVKDFSEVIELVAIGAGRTKDGKPSSIFKIERDGKIFDIEVLPQLIKTNLSTGDEIRMVGITPALTMQVAQVMKNSPAEKFGIKKGDIVVEFNGLKLYSNAHLGECLNNLKAEEKAKISVLRDGKKVVLEILPKKIQITKALATIATKSGDTLELFISNKNNQKSEIGIPKIYTATKSDSLAKIKVGDVVCDVNGKQIDSLEALKNVIEKSKNSAIKFSMAHPDGEIFDLTLDSPISIKINPPTTKTMLGYSISPQKIISHPSIIEQFSDSIERTINALSSLINPKSDVGIKSLAGPVDIGRVIYQLSLTDFMLVISFAVLLNVNLAFLNLLPIPVLDGGHILFAIIEKLRGKPLPPNFFATIQVGFTILFISLMFYIVFYGFMRWDGDAQLENEEDVNAEYYIKDLSF